MAVRRRHPNNRKLSAALYKRAAKYQALANYLYKLAESNEQAPQESKTEGGAVVPATPSAGQGVAQTSNGAAEKTDEKTTSLFNWSDINKQLPYIGAGIAGAGIGGVTSGALARLFLGDEEKARKWVLLSALLGMAAGSIAGVYGMQSLMNIPPLAPAEAPKAK